MKSNVLALMILALVGVMISGCQQGLPAAEDKAAASSPVWEWASVGVFGTTHPVIDPASFEVDIDRMLTLAWWNQPSMIDALDLGTEQRTKMNEVMDGYLSKWGPMSGKRADGKGRMIEAIIARDFETARRISDELAWAAAYFQASPSRLKVEVFALLSDEQMQKVIDEQPFLLRSKWIRSTSLESD